MHNYKITIIFSLFLTLSFSTVLFAQGNRNGVCFTPTKANKINGLAIGLWNRPQTQVAQNFNGVNIEMLGSGWLTPFLGLDDAGYTKHNIHRINGVSIGLTLLNGKMNGLTISPTINTTFYSNGVKVGLFNVDLHRANGVQFALINTNEENNGVIVGVYNKASTTRGLQLGLINKSDNLTGLQIGLININSSRILPFVNWRVNQVK